MQDDSTRPLINADHRTIFVLGNGPSLRGVSLPALSPYATIGLNAAYRYWREIDWRPTYYCCLDTVVGMSHKDAIRELIEERQIEKFLLRSNLVAELGAAAEDVRVLNFDALRARKSILREPTVTTGSHAALWAASMGYDRIILLGVDSQYKEFIEGAERREGIELEVIKAGENPNYFFDGYQQPGDRYNIPNPRPGLHVGAWRSAGVALARAGVEVYNGNASSAVRCFPFIELDAFLKGSAEPTPADEPIDPSAASEGTPAASGGAMARTAQFFRANLALCLAPGALVAAAFALLLAAGDFSPLAMAGLFFFAALVWALFIALFYTRYAISRHLNALQLETQSLAEQINDLERLEAARNNQHETLPETPHATSLHA